MIPQYVAASLVSENKVLAHPASVDSIPTSAGQEDHVSMGNASALKAWRVLANAERALAIELLAGAQGVEFLAPLEPGAGVPLQRGRTCVRCRRGWRDDRSLTGDIEAIAGIDSRREPRGGGRSRDARSARVRQRRLRWDAPARDSSIPKHPYRDTALVYGGMALVVVLIAWATGGGL